MFHKSVGFDFIRILIRKRTDRKWLEREWAFRTNTACGYRLFLLKGVWLDHLKMLTDLLLATLPSPISFSSCHIACSPSLLYLSTFSQCLSSSLCPFFIYHHVLVPSPQLSVLHLGMKGLRLLGNQAETEIHVSEQLSGDHARCGAVFFFKPPASEMTHFLPYPSAFWPSSPTFVQDRKKKPCVSTR